MKTSQWKLLLAGMLVAGSFLVYLARWLLFPDPALHNELLRYFLDDIAFLLIQVPAVTLFIDRLMQSREREAMMQKLNMVIGAFFSQIGSTLLHEISACDTSLRDVDRSLIARAEWSPSDFAAAREAAVLHAGQAQVSACDLTALSALLAENKSFLLGLLSNQTLLEHETFTDLLWAVTHLAEELEARSDLTALPAADRAHITGDIRRAYGLLLGEWLDYLKHLQGQYPYLYSLAVRTNPLDPAACAEIAA